jgi:TonB family protein
MRLPAAILVCLCAFGQESQTPLPEGVYRAGNGVTAPMLVGRTDPEYSEEARLARLIGDVKLSFVVGEDGKVRDVRAVSPSLGLGLDEKATEAVRAWRFKPGLKDGMPVPVRVDLESSFRLAFERGAWALSRAAFRLPEGVAARPVLTLAPYPSIYTATGETGSVGISFDINPEGGTENLHIENSSSSAAEREVISIVRGWQFRPGVKDGQPVSVRCTLEFVKGNLK